MTWQYKIEVRFRTEGECVYRKEESEIPRIPDWSIYSEGGRTYTKSFHKTPTPLPCKKRLFKPTLFYKAYHVEYYAWHKTTINGVITKPSERYLKWVTEIIKPLPNEKLIESRSTIVTTDPFIFHHADFYYRFDYVESAIQAIFEKQEEGYFQRENLGNGHFKDVPVDDEMKWKLDFRERTMKNLFSTVSQAINKEINCLDELYYINPEDVEKKIGIGYMSAIEPSAKKFGWGAVEYWEQLKHKNELQKRLLHEIKIEVRNARHEQIHRAIFDLEQLTKDKSEEVKISTQEFIEKMEKEWYVFQTSIDNAQDLITIRPEDVEKRIGLKKMSMFEEEARELGWGSDEYWDQLLQNGRKAEHDFCLGYVMSLYEDMLKESRIKEEEYKEHPELFEDITIIKEGKAFVQSYDEDIDIALVCDIFDKVAKYMEAESTDDRPDDGVLNFYYSMDADFLSDNIFILPTLKIAVRRKQKDVNETGK